VTETSVHKVVRDHYADRARQAASCCGPDSADACCTAARELYPVDLVSELPQDVTSFSLGCGDPITLAELEPGQSVLDLGSGGGLDCFLAARAVGDQGSVIGVDMTPEMIEKARGNASRLGVTNVEFREGYLEDLPVEDDSIDVVVSNCVINLAPDKEQVLGEAFRVLRPGGKLAVSDIVTDGPLPEPIKQSLSAWAGCVAGAIEVDEYVRLMEAVGFTDVSVQPDFFDKETLDAALADTGVDITARGISRDEVYTGVFSARITGHKPG
jgi:arsenite methyltransferase